MGNKVGRQKIWKVVDKDSLELTYYKGGPAKAALFALCPPAGLKNAG